MKLPRYRIEDRDGRYFSHMVYQNGVYRPIFTTLVKQASVFLSISDASDICKLFPELKIITYD